MDNHSGVDQGARVGPAAIPPPQQQQQQLPPANALPPAIQAQPPHNGVQPLQMAPQPAANALPVLDPVVVAAAFLAMQQIRQPQQPVRVAQIPAAAIARQRPRSDPQVLTELTLRQLHTQHYREHLQPHAPDELLYVLRVDAPGVFIMSDQRTALTIAAARILGDYDETRGTLTGLWGDLTYLIDEDFNEILPLPPVSAPVKWTFLDDEEEEEDIECLGVQIDGLFVPEETQPGRKRRRSKEGGSTSSKKERKERRICTVCREEEECDTADLQCGHVALHYDCAETSRKMASKPGYAPFNCAECATPINNFIRITRCSPPSSSSGSSTKKSADKKCVRCRRIDANIASVPNGVVCMCEPCVRELEAKSALSGQPPKCPCCDEDLTRNRRVYF